MSKACNCREDGCDCKKRTGIKFAIGAALGVAAGVIAGVLFAPKSGKETRKDLKDFGDKAVKEGKDASKDFAKTNQSLRVEYIRRTHHKRIYEYIK